MTGRFVVLRHEMPEGAERPSHWDLLWEAGDVLRAWALDAPPQPGTTTSVLPLPDHRRVYLDYEGAVSGDRGLVTRYDAGQFRLESDEPGIVVVRLEGAKFQGEVRLWVEKGRWRATFKDEG